MSRPIDYATVQRITLREVDRTHPHPAPWMAQEVNRAPEPERLPEEIPGAALVALLQVIELRRQCRPIHDRGLTESHGGGHCD